ncbi:hypothetical protein NDU88_006526 [Pleurodeles waltl]|uniref:Uncharacterized protein n=1 Tax=Pleurodeles waltl TaxID=8319 RepID=A0AAV7NYC6_PLEWA|nr:hypothetical protein NDU88_006526 [Pleurodeles waltl]
MLFLFSFSTGPRRWLLPPVSSGKKERKKVHQELQNCALALQVIWKCLGHHLSNKETGFSTIKSFPHLGNKDAGMLSAPGRGKGQPLPQTLIEDYCTAQAPGTQPRCCGSSRVYDRTWS